MLRALERFCGESYDVSAEKELLSFQMDVGNFEECISMLLDEGIADNQRTILVMISKNMLANIAQQRKNGGKADLPNFFPDIYRFLISNYNGFSTILYREWISLIVAWSYQDASCFEIVINGENQHKYEFLKCFLEYYNDDMFNIFRIRTKALIMINLQCFCEHLLGNNEDIIHYLSLLIQSVSYCDDLRFIEPYLDNIYSYIDRGFHYYLVELIEVISETSERSTDRVIMCSIIEHMVCSSKYYSSQDYSILIWDAIFLAESIFFNDFVDQEFMYYLLESFLLFLGQECDLNNDFLSLVENSSSIFAGIVENEFDSFLCLLDQYVRIICSIVGRITDFTIPIEFSNAIASVMDEIDDTFFQEILSHMEIDSSLFFFVASLKDRFNEELIEQFNTSFLALDYIPYSCLYYIARVGILSSEHIHSFINIVLETVEVSPSCSADVLYNIIIKYPQYTINYWDCIFEIFKRNDIKNASKYAACLFSLIPYTSQEHENDVTILIEFIIHSFNNAIQVENFDQISDLLRFISEVLCKIQTYRNEQIEAFHHIYQSVIQEISFEYIINNYDVFFKFLITCVDHRVCDYQIPYNILIQVPYDVFSPSFYYLLQIIRKYNDCSEIIQKILHIPINMYPIQCSNSLSFFEYIIREQEYSFIDIDFLFNCLNSESVIVINKVIPFTEFIINRLNSDRVSEILTQIVSKYSLFTPLQHQMIISLFSSIPNYHQQLIESFLSSNLPESILEFVVKSIKSLDFNELRVYIKQCF